jgi:uncharacterized membrane protein YbhN (UPF0104 family)
MKTLFSAQPKSLSKIIAPVGVALISFGVLGLLIYRPREALAEFDWQFNWGAAAIAFAFYSLDLFLVALIWAWVMDALGAKIGLMKHIRYYCMSLVARRLPGTIWYVVGRVYLYRQEGVASRLTSVASGVELVITNMSAILVVLIFALPAIAQYRLGYLGLAGAFLLGAILIHPKVLDWLLRRFKVEVTKSFSSLKILQWLSTYMVAWIVGGLILYMIGNVVTTIALNHLPYVIGVWSLVGFVSSATFFLPSNLGITEVSISLLLSSIMPSPMAVLVAIAARILILIYEIAWAVVFAWLNPPVIQE